MCRHEEDADEINICLACHLPTCNDRSAACPWRIAHAHPPEQQPAPAPATRAQRVAYMREYRRKNRDRLNAHARDYVHNLSDQQKAARLQRRRDGQRQWRNAARKQTP